MKGKSLSADFRRFASRIMALKKQAAELGVFTGERDLLSCKSCGLFEDVLAGTGFLIVKRPRGKKDCGLRFRPFGHSQKHFQCPNCRALV